MKGFLRRDRFLLGGILYAYLCIGVMLLIARAVPMGWLAALFVSAFTVSFLERLFLYDKANGWWAYAAATPGGRRAMVDARYLTALFMVGLVAALRFCTGLTVVVLDRGLSWGRVANMTALYAGAVLLAAALLLSVEYAIEREGFLGKLWEGLSNWVPVSIGVGCFVAEFWDVMARPGWHPWLLALPAAGGALMALSWRRSRRSMERREF